MRTVGRQIAEPILLHEPATTRREADRRVGELLEQVGLPARRASAYPHRLSGGQRQRVMIALALACRPGLVIADEPTTALDVMVQAQVLQLLTGLVRDLGLALMLISHDLSVLGSACDRVAGMYLGRVVESGPCADVLLHPRHPYTRALLSVVPEVSRTEPIVLTGETPDPSRIPVGCRFRPRCPAYLSGEAERAGVADACERGELPVLPADDGHHTACLLPAADEDGGTTSRGTPPGSAPS